jgi:toxin ParE1/3/4
VSRAVIQQPEAVRDLREIAFQIGRTRPQSARRFLQAADRTFGQIAARPGIGARCEFDHPALADIRVCRVTRFRNHLVFYRATDDRIEILRVLHAARDVDGILADQFAPPDGPDRPDEGRAH